MKNLEFFYRTQGFERKKRVEVYKEYTIMCETLDIPKVKRAKKRDLFKFYKEKGYVSVRHNTGDYFIKRNGE
ncbi:MAG: hypothetical protein ACRC1D_08255 [Culicoidibacterales bacterium]